MQIGDFNKCFRYFSILMTPAAFVVSPWLLLIMVICQLFTYFQCAENMADKFILMFLCATTFTGISVFSFKLYDILIFLFFVYMLARRDKDLYITSEQILYFFVVLAVFFIHFHTTAFLEVFRYAISIMLMVLVQSDRIALKEYQTEIISIIAANLYYALSVYIFTSMGWAVNHSNRIISTAVYIESAEVRLNGFFTDPNKYTVFCFTMLILVHLFFDDNRMKKAGIFLLVMEAVISGSRMGVVGIALFLAFEAFGIFKEKNRILLTIFSCMILACAAIWIMFPGIVTSLLNGMYFFVTKLLGRAHTLELFENVSEDGRVLIWKSAVTYIKEHPFLGHGWLSYEQLLSYLTHNTFLSLLLDGGLFMVSAYLCFFRKIFFGKDWMIMVPLFFLPVFLLDLCDFRMHYLLLALLEAGRERVWHGIGGKNSYDAINYSDEKVGAKF